MLALEITGKLRSSNTGDTTYTTLKTAFVSDATVDLMILDAAKDQTGATGFRAAFQLFDASQDQGLSVGAVYDEVTFKPAPNTDGNYTTVLITGGAPVFTAA